MMSHGRRVGHQRMPTDAPRGNKTALTADAPRANQLHPDHMIVDTLDIDSRTVSRVCSLDHDRRWSA